MRDVEEYSYRNGICFCEAALPSVGGFAFLIGGVLCLSPLQGLVHGTITLGIGFLICFAVCCVAAVYPILLFLNETVTVDGERLVYRNKRCRITSINLLPGAFSIMRIKRAPVYTLRVSCDEGVFTFSSRINNFFVLRDKILSIGPSSVEL